MKLNIDLGKERDLTVPTGLSKEKYYPRFTYDSDEEMKLPKEGEMIIYYRKVANEERTGEDGKTRYSCTIEVRKLESVDSEDEVEAPASNRGKDTESALDALVAAHMKSKSEKY